MVNRKGSAWDAYTISTTSPADVDATNMVITFTAPASGKVLVRLTAYNYPPGSGYHIWYGLREGTTNIGQVIACEGTTTSDTIASCPIYLTGLSAGSHTYKWAAWVDSGSANLYYGANAGGATMEVWAAP